MKYVYPVIFEDDEGKIGVTVPDIPSTFTFGDDMADAIFMAQDVIAMMIATCYEDEGKEAHGSEARVLLRELPAGGTCEDKGARGKIREDRQPSSSGCRARHLTKRIPRDIL